MRARHAAIIRGAIHYARDVWYHRRTDKYEPSMFDGSLWARAYHHERYNLVKNWRPKPPIRPAGYEFRPPAPPGYKPKADSPLTRTSAPKLPTNRKVE